MGFTSASEGGSDLRGVYQSITVLATSINIAGNQEILTNCCRSTNEPTLSRKQTKRILSRDRNKSVVSNKSYWTFA